MNNLIQKQNFFAGIPCSSSSSVVAVNQIQISTVGETMKRTITPRQGGIETTELVQEILRRLEKPRSFEYGSVAGKGTQRHRASPTIGVVTANNNRRERKRESVGEGIGRSVVAVEERWRIGGGREELLVAF